MSLGSIGYSDWWRAVPKTRRTLGLVAVFCVGIINFIAFCTIANWIGGDALNGKVQDARFFLSNHGHLREVSKAVFMYSRWHALSLMVTHPLAILCAFWLNRDVRRAIERTRRDQSNV